MTAQEIAQYEACHKDLDRLYGELDLIQAEFRDLVSQMAAQLLAEKTSS